MEQTHVEETCEWCGEKFTDTYHLKLDPYDGSIYVFRDSAGSMLKYIEWDGQSFLQGKQRAQSGTYPWPGGQARHVVEINERELEQISLFNEVETVADSDAAKPDLEQVTYKRKKRKGKREADFSSLPVEQIVHELPEAERVCPDCGEPLHICGHTVLRRELVYVPARYSVVEHIQTAYSCRCCEQKNDHVPMKKSEVPPALLPGSGLVCPSLLAHILSSKYVLALPLYRQEQEFQRLGVSISRQTMANWVIAVYQRWFAGFFQLLRRELLANSVLHADETTLMVLREPGRKARQKSADIRGRSPAQKGLEFCNKLFKLEEGYTKQGLSFEQRYLARMKQSKPVAEEFFLWAKMEYDKNPVPKSMLGAALTYAVRQESWLMNAFWTGGWNCPITGRNARYAPCFGAKKLVVFQHTEGSRRQPQFILLLKPQKQIS